MRQPACVGAGLPAIESPRSNGYTEVTASQASRLPHLLRVTTTRSRPCSQSARLPRLSSHANGGSDDDSCSSF
ncbi:hypothetical protein B5P22_06755 [Pseudomonas tolaasii]|nr:hypothetical protein B5P22_06755 [Pseudomonas tolaasii]